MCTLSIITVRNDGDGRGGAPRLRIVVNRDEERDRPPAIAPRWHDLPAGAGRFGRRAIWPIDPLGGGTWVAASEAGLALAVLNGNPEPRPPEPSAERVLSRGGIIPTLIGGAGAGAAIERARGEVEWDRYPPMRLVAAEPGRVASIEWDGRLLRESAHDARACCFVSSGLGDRCVRVRVPLFEAMVAGDPTPARQDAFHAHRWPERPELSVLMSRSAARTVSVTTVEVGAGVATMTYREVAEPPGVPVERGSGSARGAGR